MSSSIISPLDYCHVELIRSQKFVLYLVAYKKYPHLENLHVWFIIYFTLRTQAAIKALDADIFLYWKSFFSAVHWAWKSLNGGGGIQNYTLVPLQQKEL